MHRAFTVLSALLFLVLEMAASVDAAPASLASSPFLDGRPTLVAVAPAPRWTPPDGDEFVLVRYQGETQVRYGLVDGTSVLELSSSLYEHPRPTGLIHALSDLELLPPIGGDHVEALVVSAGREGLEPLRWDRMLGPGGKWILTEGTGCSSQRAAIHVPGVGSQIRPRVGVTCGLLLQDPEGRTTLASGPALVVGGVAAESDVDAASLRGLRPGTVVVELLETPRGVEPGRLEATLGGIGSLVVNVT